jgi:hypothetical protein
VEARIDFQRGLVTVSGFGKASGLAVDDAQFIVRGGLLRVYFEREQQIALRRLEITGTMMCDTEIDAWCAQIRCSLGDRFEQREAVLVAALLQVGERPLVISAHGATDAGIFGYRKPDLLLNFYMGRRACRLRCRTRRKQECHDREQ